MSGSSFATGSPTADDSCVGPSAKSLSMRSPFFPSDASPRRTSSSRRSATLNFLLMTFLLPLTSSSFTDVAVTLRRTARRRRDFDGRRSLRIIALLLVPGARDHGDAPRARRAADTPAHGTARTCHATPLIA